MKLKEALKNELSDSELNALVRGYDVVGDIAVTIIPPALEKKEKLIGEAILSVNKNVRVVTKRNGIYEGEFRTIPLTIIAGEQRKETIHKEHGIKFLVNPETVYFSVRSGSERKRIATLAAPDETILVMFSGIGPYPLVLAKHSRARMVVGIEKNDIAHSFALRNLKLNKKLSRVIFYHGDVETVLPLPGLQFDRIIMPLPTAAVHYLDLALANLKKKGWLHVYDFQSPQDYLEKHRELKIHCRRLGRHCLATKTFVCGHVSPALYRVCMDTWVD